ncbi:MAG: LPS export ABC transporter periplasmic protein LptC [Chitinophagales bacterium]|nr:LPS export ABC transporter periplasmic protein LptC [Bacteroidota bacterium]
MNNIFQHINKKTKQPFRLFLCLFMLVFIPACKENDLAKVKAIFNEDDVQIEKADSVIFTYKEGEYIRAVVTGKVIRRYTKSQNKIDFPDGLLVKFYQQLQLISILKADYAMNDDANQTIKVSGNVYMENYKHEKLETDELTWDMRTKKIFTNKPIKLKTPDNYIYGVGFNAAEDFSNYTIRKVTGVVAVNNENEIE